MKSNYCTLWHASKTRLQSAKTDKKWKCEKDFSFLRFFQMLISKTVENPENGRHILKFHTFTFKMCQSIDPFKNNIQKSLISRFFVSFCRSLHRAQFQRYKLTRSIHLLRIPCSLRQCNSFSKIRKLTP